MSSTASGVPTPPASSSSTPESLAKLQRERTILINCLQDLSDQESYLNPRLQRIAFEREVLECRVALLDQQIASHLHPLP
jgi:hypothetical protein